MARYSYQTQSRASLLLPFVGMAGVAMVIPIIAISQQTWGALPFFVVWVVIGAFVASQLLGRISYRLESDGETLRWFTPLRRGEVPVREIVAITQGLSGRETIFEVRDGDDVVCVTRRGIIEFAEVVADDSGIPVDVEVPLSLRIGSVRDRFSRDD